MKRAASTDINVDCDTAVKKVVTILNSLCTPTATTSTPKPTATPELTPEEAKRARVEAKKARQRMIRFQNAQFNDKTFVFWTNKLKRNGAPVKIEEPIIGPMRIWDTPTQTLKDVSVRTFQVKIHDLLELLHSDEVCTDDPVEMLRAAHIVMSYIEAEISLYTKITVLRSVPSFNEMMAVEFGLLLYSVYLKEVRDYIYTNYPVESDTVAFDTLSTVYNTAWDAMLNMGKTAEELKLERGE